MPDELIPCLKCVHAEALENEPNIKCLHPLVKKFGEDAKSQGPLQRIAISLEMKGPRGGWPFNFAPEWVESCKGFATEKPVEPKPEEVKDVVEPAKAEETEKVEEEKPKEEEAKEESIAPLESPPKPEDKALPKDETPFTFGKKPKKEGG